jgi:hypothetical protein
MTVSSALWGALADTTEGGMAHPRHDLPAFEPNDIDGCLAGWSVR